MSKIIIITTHEKWNRQLQTICKETGMEIFPNGVRSFHKLKNALCYIKINEAQTALSSMLTNFIADEEDYIFIIEYTLKQSKSVMNGLDFYRLFGKGQPAIFISDTDNLKDIEKIQHFCNESSNCIFISKLDEDWEKMVKEIIN